MRVVRVLLVLAAVVLAVVLQVSFFTAFAFDGVVPNLVLLLVVACALTRGPEVAALLGFTGGLVVDLMPPADHLAGRWALALVVVGYLAGRVRADAERSTVAALVTVAACSFVGSSIFALSGIVTGDSGVPLLEALRIVPEAMVYDLLLAPFVLPPAMRMFRLLRSEPATA